MSLTTKDITYSFVSYRVIKQSGGIYYNYAMINVAPSTWIIDLLTDEETCGDHYHITYVEEVTKDRYEMYRGRFPSDVNIPDM